MFFESLEITFWDSLKKTLTYLNGCEIMLFNSFFFLFLIATLMVLVFILYSLFTQRTKRMTKNIINVYISIFNIAYYIFVSNS